MSNKFDAQNHKFGIAYIAYEVPFKPVIVYPDEVREIVYRTSLYSALIYEARFYKEWVRFVDMTRMPERDFASKLSHFVPMPVKD